MSLYQETVTFIMRCSKLLTQISKMPDIATKTAYAAPDILANARAIHAAAEGVSAAAASVVEQFTPKPPHPEVHNHYAGPRPSPVDRGAATVAHASSPEI
jgi:hypothetical protein